MALLSDGAENFVVMQSHPKLPCGLYRADADGWILGMQRDPYYVRTHRVDRQKLGQLMGALATRPLELASTVAELDRNIDWQYAGATNSVETVPVDHLLVDGDDF